MFVPVSKQRAATQSNACKPLGLRTSNFILSGDDYLQQVLENVMVEWIQKNSERESELQ